SLMVVSNQLMMMMIFPFLTIPYLNERKEVE
ncbi:MAG: hypothetical protein ACI8RD_008553, partial [Bacillariaceae sp.]